MPLLNLIPINVLIDQVFAFVLALLFFPSMVSFVIGTVQDFVSLFAPMMQEMAAGAA